MEGEVGRFRRRHLVPVPRVESLAELNALLEAADRADDARHIAGRLATVGAMAEAEQPSLRPLPAEPFDPTVALQAKADRKARIAVRGSVPAACAGRTVDVRLGGRTVTALLGGRVVARPREQRPLRLDGVVAALERLDRNHLGGSGLGRSPPGVDQQRLGVRRDLLHLGEHRLDGVGVLLAGDDPARQREHQVAAAVVVAAVVVGGEAVLGQLALHGERGLELLRHELEGVRLQGVSGRP